MTKLAIFLILSLGLAVVGRIEAQSREEVFIFQTISECARFGIPEAFVQKEYGEKPFTQAKIILRAKNTRLYEANLVTFVNPETKTHSLIVQFIEDGYSCVLGSGTDLGPAFEIGKSL